MFEVSDLGGGQIVVEDHHVGIVPLDQQCQFGDLALAKVGCLVGTITPLCHFGDDLRPGGLRQPAKLAKGVFRVDRHVEQHAHKHRAFALHAVGSLWLRHSYSSSWVGAMLASGSPALELAR